MSDTAVTADTPALDLDLDYDELSDAQRLALQPPSIVDEFFSSLTDEEAKALLYEWSFWARRKQKPPPGNWTYWLTLAGRGWGKTQTVVHWAIDKARDMPRSRGAIVAPTAADARDVLVEGASGILASSDPDFMPVYEPSKRRLTWPNGSVATIFSADQPDRLRGPQFHWAIADELAAWRYPDAWDMLQFGLRLGDNPQCAIATTPRPTAVIKELVADENCIVTHGTTYENRENLAPAFFRQVIAKYENTRLGRQELLAQILDDVPGALWNRNLLDATRVRQSPDCFKIVVAVDPASSTGTTGIIVVGVGKVDGANQGYVLEDCTTEAGASPGAWGLAAVQAYHRWKADAIVAEVNHGGNMVEHVIRTVEGGKNVSYRAVRASRGKYTRAEPVASLFEQAKAHCVGMLGLLEDELCTWIPGEDSPNRLDAMVWGFTDLMLDGAQDVAMPPPVGMNKPSQWRN
jgi:phage terminase large subunit-like protein